MYCTKCGTKAAKTAKYCSKCGFPVNENEEINQYISSQPTYREPVYQTPEDSKKRRNALFIALGFGLLSILMVVVFFGGIIYLAFKTVSEFQENAFFTFGEAKVESFFNVAEDGKLCSFSENTVYSDESGYSIELNVCSYDDFKEEIDKYLDYMIEKYGYKENHSKYYRTIYLRYNDSNYVVEISVDLDNNNIYYKLYYDERYKQDSNERKDNVEHDKENIPPVVHNEENNSVI